MLKQDVPFKKRKSSGDADKACLTSFLTFWSVTEIDFSYKIWRHTFHHDFWFRVPTPESITPHFENLFGSKHGHYNTNLLPIDYWSNQIGPSRPSFLVDEF